MSRELACFLEAVITDKKAVLTTSVSNASSSSVALLSPPSHGSRSFSLCSPFTLALMAESVKASTRERGGMGVKSSWLSRGRHCMH